MKRRTALITSAAASLVALAGAASPALADDQGVGYRGTFDARTFTTCTSDGQAVTPYVGIVTGSWRVNAHDTKATARFVIDVDGAPHVAYTTQMTRLADDAATFSATTRTAAGDLVVRLEGDIFTYTISPYADPFGAGFTCDSVVYSGTSD
jgi:uncharacterized protein YbjQ (UPF0145 family)